MPVVRDELADDRERFLTAEPAKSGAVRPTILASWQRSKKLKVAADKIELPYTDAIDADTPLTRSAERVLRRLRDQLDGQPVSVIMTDATGLVLSRRSGSDQLDRHLDGVLLAPGFSYAEQFVGTNGIGTALEAGTATHVFGHEHYAENLEDLACAGVPIRHPISGRTIGVVDLTCWRKDAELLLLTLAKATAEQIEQALLTDSGLHELELLQAYRRTCRRMAGIVLAVARDAVMLNDHARAVLDPADQSALLAQAASVGTARAAGERWTDEITLPTGASARTHYNQVGVGDEIAGVVVHVQLGDAEAPAATRPATAGMLLPGLVGQEPLWLRACRDVEEVFRGGEWLVVEGEAGVGKLALLRAVQVRRQPPGRFAVLDATSAATDTDWPATVRRTLGEADSVVIRRIDQLDGRRLRTLSAALQETHARRTESTPWVVVTLTGGVQGKALADLLRLFPRTVDVPPLRLHREDVRELVPFFLARLGHNGQLTCSPEAMRLLMRSPWPGNVAELHGLLHDVVQKRRRAGQIQPDDLPPQLRTFSRRVLSPMESMERDAIVTSLANAQGNKVKAARSLGMSRATIYRKIHDYGIVAPATPVRRSTG